MGTCLAAERRLCRLCRLKWRPVKAICLGQSLPLSTQTYLDHGALRLLVAHCVLKTADRRFDHRMALLRLGQNLGRVVLRGRNVDRANPMSSLARCDDIENRCWLVLRAADLTELAQGQQADLRLENFLVPQKLPCEYHSSSERQRAAGRML